jgi:hypothetical protein
MSEMAIFHQLSLDDHTISAKSGKAMSPEELVDLIDALEGKVNNGGLPPYIR